jgi:hypothetical protein
MLRKTAHVAHFGIARQSYAKLVDAAISPIDAQRERLSGALAVAANAAYGKQFGLTANLSIDAFQNQVPICSWSDIEPWIERITNGESNILTTESLQALEPTSGSTSKRKLVPFTKSAMAEFSLAANAWIYTTMAEFPALWGTTSYWSISPLAHSEKVTKGGIPIGFEHDTAFFGRIGAKLMDAMHAVSKDVRHIQDMDAWRHETVRQLVADPNLGLISIWSPTFLVPLMRHLETHLDSVLDGLPKSRRNEVAAAVKTHGIQARAIWPKLALLSTWTDGASASAANQLRTWFHDIPIQPKGLAATEGIVSIPAGPAGPVAAAHAFFLEFIPLHDNGGADQRRPCLVHELEVGQRYEPLLTTSAGLLRYRLGDVIECTGHWHRLPQLRFIGRAGRTSDLVGEKLSAELVEPIVVSALITHANDLPALVMLTPAQSPARYILWVDGTQDLGEKLAQTVEEKLLQIHHYGYARKLEQLGPVQAIAAPGLWSKVQDWHLQDGMRLGDIKPRHYDHRLHWSETLQKS